MKLHIRFGVAGLIAALSLGISAQPRRQHYSVLERDRQSAFEVTRIYDAQPNRTIVTFLIGDAKGPLMTAVLTDDYTQKENRINYRLMRGSRSEALVVVSLPFQSNTRAGVAEELKTHSFDESSIPIRIEGPGRGVLTGTNDRWRSGDSGPSQRARAQDLLGHEMVKAMNAVRELAGLPMFGDLNMGFEFFFGTTEIVRRSTKLMVATTRNDCAFDAKFGVACEQVSAR
jgi:hypothetical protein